jgi:hypothetical protein
MRKMHKPHESQIGNYGTPSLVSASRGQSIRLLKHQVGEQGDDQCSAQRVESVTEGMILVRIGILKIWARDEGGAILPMAGFSRRGDQRSSARRCHRADDCAHRRGDTKS